MVDQGSGCPPHNHQRFVTLRMPRISVLQVRVPAVIFDTGTLVGPGPSRMDVVWACKSDESVGLDLHGTGNILTFNSFLA